MSENVINTSHRFTSRGTVTWQHGTARLTHFSTRWTLVTEEDLGLEAWVGIGDRPHVSYFWAAFDEEGRIDVLVPATNFLLFERGNEPKKQNAPGEAPAP